MGPMGWTCTRTKSIAVNQTEAANMIEGRKRQMQTVGTFLAPSQRAFFIFFSSCKRVVGFCFFCLG